MKIVAETQEFILLYYRREAEQGSSISEPSARYTFAFGVVIPHGKMFRKIVLGIRNGYTKSSVLAFEIYVFIVVVWAFPFSG